jgi:putative endopeptidase
MFDNIHFVIKLLLGVITLCGAYAAINLVRQYVNCPNFKDNYYRNVNYKWLTTEKIPKGFSRFSNFHKLTNDNNDRLQQIAKEDKDKVGYLYQQSLKIPESSSKYIDEMQNRIMAVNDKIELYREMAALWTEYGVNTIFMMVNARDDKDSEITVPNVYQSGLTMPDKSYYDGSEDHKQHREAFVDYVNLLGTENHLTLNGEKVYELEAFMADKHLSREQRRDPHLIYNKMNWTDFAACLPDFTEALADLPDMDYVIVDCPEYYRSFHDELYNKFTFDEVRSYVVFKLVDHYAQYGTRTQRDLYFDFHSRTLNGIKEPKDMWRQALANIDRYIPDDIGQIFIEKYYPRETREFMEKMVEDIRRHMHIVIDEITWMTDGTKKTAHKKIDNMKFHLGRPNEYHSYDGLWDVKDHDQLTDMVVEFYRWNWRHENTERFYRPTNRNLWEMYPHMVNACYSPNNNEMCFPAGILQPPFLDMKKNIGHNLGSIGMVIAHEMTHGLDDQGRQYDENGNLRDWWTKEDNDNFVERSKVVREQYETKLVQGKPINGNLTMGENIADIGGLNLVSGVLFELNFDADNEQDEQWNSFFEGFAQTFRTISHPEIELKLLTIDPHSPVEHRTNLPLMNNLYFQEFMDIQEGNGMWIDPEDMVDIW